jgi:hypothetical protein
MTAQQTQRKMGPLGFLICLGFFGMICEQLISIHPSLPPASVARPRPTPSHPAWNLPALNGRTDEDKRVIIEEGERLARRIKAWEDDERRAGREPYQRYP